MDLFPSFSPLFLTRREINVREWVRDLWDEWFDEVYPPSEAASVVGSQVDLPQQSLPSAATQAKG